MKCPEPVFDKRTKKERACNAEIYGLTGLQELDAFMKHMRKKHGRHIGMMEAMEIRSESGQ